MKPRTGPLSHVKVLDLSRILAAPWAGQILADLGADVIKVERPGDGDDALDQPGIGEVDGVAQEPEQEEQEENEIKCLNEIYFSWF